MATTKPRRPSKPSRVGGRKLRTYELSNIERPVTHKMKPLRSGAVVHKKHGEHKKPTHPKGVKAVSTPETRSIDLAKRVMAKAARPPRGHKHERKVRTVKFTNIESTPKKSNKSFPTPKQTPKSKIE